MSNDYYVTPYEDGCAIERDGEGIISVHGTEAEAVRQACQLADQQRCDVLVRTPRAGRCQSLPRGPVAC